MTDPKLHNQNVLNEAVNIISWNKWLLTPLGLWPEAPKYFIFYISFCYCIFHLYLEYVDLYFRMGNLERVIENLTENLAITQIITRFAMLKKYNQQLGFLINGIVKDYNVECFKNDMELKVFLNYIKKAKLLIKMLGISLLATVTSYFLKPITSSPPTAMLDSEDTNSTTPFILPYHFHLLYTLNDSRTYILTYASQFLFLSITGIGQMAGDCLMITLVFHVSGKLAVLAVKIADMKYEDAELCKKELNEIIIEHNRLLELGTNIKEAFSDSLFIYLVEATLLICILGFQLLRNYARGENAEFATFIVFIASVILILYIQCSIGETLVTESNKVCEAYYNCKWYDMPIDTAKSLILCIKRSQKPLGLTAGKFKVLCLTTLTDVIKSSMAYLSVLRSLIVI